MDVMLDLETYGVRPGAAIRSVGAVAFRLGAIEHPETDNSFRARIRVVARKENVDVAQQHQIEIAGSFALDATGQKYGLTRREPEPRTFYRCVTDESCREAGLQFERGTVDWWAAQPREARDALLVDPQPLVKVLREFKAWWADLRAERVWAQGANFDPVLLEHACAAFRLEAPWRYYNVRDTRTLYDIAGLDPRSVAREGTCHNALDDARHQVRCAQAAWEQLYRGVVAD